jgi:hypothetical protein
MSDLIMFAKARELAEGCWLPNEHGVYLSRFRPIDLFDSQDQLAFADFLGFNAGRIICEDTGWPATQTFDLSTKAVSAFAATDAYSARAAITGTGYTQKTQAEPAATAATLGQKAWTVLSWATGAAADWQNPSSIVVSDGTVLYCAWNLVPGGAAQAMNAANTTINVTPTYLPTNPP